MEFLFSVQRWIQSVVSADLSAYASSGRTSVLLAMLPVGVMFGAVHALTPGHSKAMLASYLIGSRLKFLRALAVAALLASVHVGTAVLLAAVGASLVTRTIGGVGQAPTVEIASRLLLVAIGIWMVVRAALKRPHTHGEGAAVGLSAGLIPCPLTLFAMIFAFSRGVPEAGFAFAVAMLVGVGHTLCAVAALIDDARIVRWS